jgi:hypothetical protein
MKKIVAGILSVIYITVTSGIVVNIHYCMGRINNIDYTYNNSNKCCKCGMENKKGCCHNEFKMIRLADDQQVAKANISIAQFPADINVMAVNLLQPAQGSEKITALDYHSPPDKRLSSVYLHDCVFRI